MVIQLTLPRVDFWKKIRPLIGTLQEDTTFGMVYVPLDWTSEMRIIVRTKEEFFTDTVSREAAGLRVVVNGNYYGLSSAGKMDAALGHDPVDPSHTSVEGQLVNRGARIGGDSRPQHFYFARVPDPRPGPWLPSYTSGAGDPPGSAITAIGGVGPLIIGGLNYGTANIYTAGAPAGAPAVGQPPPAAARHLVQRSNATLTSVEAKGAATGKTIVASSTTERAILVCVQEHGAGSGRTYAALRDALKALGFTDAVFLDGSDSSMMWFKGSFRVRPGEDKDETNIVGVGFT